MTSLGTLSIELTANIKDFNSNLYAAKSAVQLFIKQINTEFSKGFKDIQMPKISTMLPKEMVTQLQSASQAALTLADSLDRVAQAGGKLGTTVTAPAKQMVASFKTTVKPFQDAGAAANFAAAQAENMRTELVATGRQFTVTEGKIEQVAGGYRVFGATAQFVDKSTQEVSDTLTRQFSTYNEAKNYIRATNKEFANQIGANEKLDLSIRRAGNGWEVFGGKVMTVRSSLISLNDFFHKIIHYITFSIGVQLVMSVRTAISNMIKDFSDFEKQATLVASVTGYLGASFVGARQDIEAFAKSVVEGTIFTPRQAMDSLYDLASAGFDVVEMARAGTRGMESFRAIMQYAEATGSDLKASTFDLVSILRQFGMELEDLPKVTDTLTTMITKTLATSEKLGEAFKYVGSMAGTLKQDFDEVSAALSTLMNRGMEGGQAGQRLTMIYTQLLDPTEEAKRTFEELGLSMTDINPEANSLVEILTKLKTAGFDSANSASIFRARTAAAAITLVGAAEEVEKYTKLAKYSSGITKELAEQSVNTLSGSMAELSASFQKASIEGGQSFAPIIRDLSKWVQGSLLPAMKNLGGALQNWLPILKAAGVIIGGFYVYLKLTTLYTKLAASGFIYETKALLTNVAAKRMAAAQNQQLAASELLEAQSSTTLANALEYQTANTIMVNGVKTQSMRNRGLTIAGNTAEMESIRGVVVAQDQLIASSNLASNTEYSMIASKEANVISTSKEGVVTWEVVAADNAMALSSAKVAGAQTIEKISTDSLTASLVKLGNSKSFAIAKSLIMSGALMNLFSVFTQGLNPINSLSMALTGIGIMIPTVLIPAFKLLGITISSSLGVIGWIIAGIGALIGVVSQFINKTEEETEEQKKLREGMKSIDDQYANSESVVNKFGNSINDLNKLFKEEIKIRKDLMEMEKNGMDTTDDYIQMQIRLKELMGDINDKETEAIQLSSTTINNLKGLNTNVGKAADSYFNIINNQEESRITGEQLNSALLRQKALLIVATDAKQRYGDTSEQYITAEQDLAYITDEVNRLKEQEVDLSESAAKYTQEESDAVANLTDNDKGLLSQIKEIYNVRKDLIDSLEEYNKLLAEQTIWGRIAEQGTNYIQEGVKNLKEEEYKLFEIEFKIYKLRKDESERMDDMFNALASEGLVTGDMIDSYKGMKIAEGEAMKQGVKFTKVLGGLSTTGQDMVTDWVEYYIAALESGESQIDAQKTANTKLGTSLNKIDGVTSDAMATIMDYADAQYNSRKATKDLSNILVPYTQDLYENGLASTEVASTYADVQSASASLLQYEKDLEDQSNKTTLAFDAIVDSATRMFLSMSGFKATEFPSFNLDAYTKQFESLKSDLPGQILDSLDVSGDALLNYFKNLEGRTDAEAVKMREKLQRMLVIKYKIPTPEIPVEGISEDWLKKIGLNEKEIKEVTTQYTVSGSDIIDQNTIDAATSNFEQSIYEINKQTGWFAKKTASSADAFKGYTEYVRRFDSDIDVYSASTASAATTMKSLVDQGWTEEDVLGKVGGQFSKLGDISGGVLSTLASDASTVTSRIKDIETEISTLMGQLGTLSSNTFTVTIETLYKEGKLTPEGIPEETTDKETKKITTAQNKIAPGVISNLPSVMDLLKIDTSGAKELGDKLGDGFIKATTSFWNPLEFIGGILGIITGGKPAGAPMFIDESPKTTITERSMQSANDGLTSLGNKVGDSAESFGRTVDLSGFKLFQYLKNGGDFTYNKLESGSSTIKSAGQTAGYSITSSGTLFNSSISNSSSFLVANVLMASKALTDAGMNAANAINRAISSIPKSTKETSKGGTTSVNISGPVNVSAPGLTAAQKDALSNTVFKGTPLEKLFKLQAGGIVTGPTPALVGEKGPEAVLPIKKLLVILQDALSKIFNKRYFTRFFDDSFIELYKKLEILRGQMQSSFIKYYMEIPKTFSIEPIAFKPIAMPDIMIDPIRLDTKTPFSFSPFPVTKPIPILSDKSLPVNISNVPLDVCVTDIKYRRIGDLFFNRQDDLVYKALNDLIGTVAKVSTIGTPMKTGGLIKEPMLTEVGEKGDEAIIPLTGRNKKYGENLLDYIIPKYFPDRMAQTGGLYLNSGIPVSNTNVNQDTMNMYGPITVVSNKPTDFMSQMKWKARGSK